MSAIAKALRLIDEGRTEEAHDLVQNDRSPEASYVHGIIHREEGDLANACYWFARAGDLPGRLGVDPMGVDKMIERHALARLLES